MSAPRNYFHNQPDPVVTAGALCKDPNVDTSIFFAQAGQLIKQAKEVCEACPVKLECLEEAMAGGDSVHGVWGGTSGRDRDKLRIKRRREAAQVA